MRDINRKQLIVGKASIFCNKQKGECGIAFDISGAGDTHVRMMAIHSSPMACQQHGARSTDQQVA
jgi:hypothetical protein